MQVSKSITCIVWLATQQVQVDTTFLNNYPVHNNQQGLTYYYEQIKGIITIQQGLTYYYEQIKGIITIDR